MPKSLYLNKDVPVQLREIGKKIRKKAGELYHKKINYEYRINGICIDGVFCHHSEIVLEGAIADRMDDQ